MMELQYEEMEYGIRLIKLIGALDNMGVRSVESKFVLHCAGKQGKVVVDLSEVEFLAPGGSGLLLWAAKEVKRRGGSLVLVNPPAAIERELVQSGIQEWTSICSNLEVAAALLVSPQPAKNTG